MFYRLMNFLLVPHFAPFIYASVCLNKKKTGELKLLWQYQQADKREIQMST